MSDTHALIEQLAKDAIVIKRARHPYVQCALWMGGLAAYMTILLCYFNLRPDWLYKLRSPYYLAEVVSLGLIAVSAGLSAALLSYPDAMQKKSLTYAPLASFALFILVLTVSWMGDTPKFPAPQHEMMCTVLITLFSLLPAIWLFYTIRKYAPTQLECAGTNAILCSFSVGALTLRLSEFTDSLPHVIEYHYLPILVMSIVGLALGKFLLKW